MKKHLLALLVIPLLAWFLMMFTAAALPREVLIEEPFNKSGLLIWQVWLLILSILHVLRSVTKRQE